MKDRGVITLIQKYNKPAKLKAYNNKCTDVHKRKYIKYINEIKYFKKGTF